MTDDTRETLRRLLAHDEGIRHIIRDLIRTEMGYERAGKEPELWLRDVLKEDGR